MHPSRISEDTQLKLGESVISSSGDVCSEGSWVFYNTHKVCYFTDHLLTFTDTFRPSHLQGLHEYLKSSFVRGMQGCHSSF